MSHSGTVSLIRKVQALCSPPPLFFRTSWKKICRLVEYIDFSKKKCSRNIGDEKWDKDRLETSISEKSRRVVFESKCGKIAVICRWKKVRVFVGIAKGSAS